MEQALQRFEDRQADKAKVDRSLEKRRDEKQAQRQHWNRLMMLMHSFLEAEAKGDHDGMRLYGRGISGYSREERQEAYQCALNARKAAGQVDVPTAAARTDGPAEPGPEPGPGAA